MKTCIIIGAGHAGGRAAAALRENGFGERILLIGDENELPYERPPLSKEVLSNEADPRKSRLFDESFYSLNHIELILDKTVSEIDIDRRLVRAGTHRLPYDSLMLCTGARPRSLDVDGGHLPGVLQLRSIEDASLLRDALKRGVHVVLIGGGFIGLEVAASAIARGCEVTIVEAQPHIMGRGVSKKIADFMEEEHVLRGVRIKTNVGVREINKVDRALHVSCSDGDLLKADVVVVGIGVWPNAEIAIEAGIPCQDGVIVDEFGRSRVSDVFSAGDVARRYNPRIGRRVRLESWENADAQSEIVARNVFSPLQELDSIPWFWTDQFDVNLQILGHREASDAAFVRGLPESRKFSIIYMRSDRVVAAEIVNNGRERRPIRRLIEQDHPVDVAKLTDIEIPISNALIQ